MALPAAADDIAMALLERALTLQVQDDVTILPVAMPEVPPPWVEADPDAEAPDRYLRVSGFDNVPRWQGMQAGEKISQGILQVEVVWPRNEGTIRPKRAAQAVLNHFPRNLILRYGSARVVIGPQEPWHGSQIPDPAGSSIPVSIPWTASGV